MTSQTDERRRRAAGVPGRVRPSEARAAAAARLVGAASGPEAVRRRLAQASRRAEQVMASKPVTRLAEGARSSKPTSRAASGRAASGRAGRSQPTVPGRTRSRTSEAGPARARRGAGTRGRADAGVAAQSRAAAAGFAAAGMAALKPDHRPDEQGRPEEHSRPRHLKVVQPGTISAAQRRRRARAVLLASIGAATVIAFALVYLHVVLAQRQFQIDRLNADVGQAQTNYQNLRLQVAGLGSPQQIISTAEGRLGMVQPTKVDYLTPTTPAPTSGATAPGPGTSTPSGAATTSGAPSSTASGAPTSTAPGTTGASPQPASGANKGVLPASQAPAGDADWPTIKSQLAGTP